jgi:5-methyltetrahydrofolate--homocysteine methyltransferase
MPANEIMDDGLLVGMTEVGVRFEQGDCFMPEMLMAAHAMKASLGYLQPLLSERKVKPIARVVMGTVQGDLHDIGKNLVCMMLEGAGFEIVDLGFDVPADKFVAAASEAQVIGLSAMLSTTMPVMGQVIQALKEAGVRDRVKVIVGGAPVNQAFAEKIGADGYSQDASSAVRKVKQLLGA